MTVSKLPITAKNFQSAQRFLDLFQYDITTFQLWQDRKQKTKPGKVVWTGEKGSSVISIEGSLLDYPDLQSDIQLHQNQGLSVWFMVNEGNGEVEEGKRTERSQASITHLTSCFVDTDNGDIRKLDKFCKENKCPYNLLVNTSKDKYHAYFLLEKTEATEENLLKWEAIQQAFMQIDKRFDRTMIDYSRVLRVPFFYHNKAEPYLIRLRQNKEVAKYSLDDLYDLTGAEQYMRTAADNAFVYPEEQVDSGSRHHSLVAYLRSLTARGLTDKEALTDAAVGFARRNFQEFKPFMPGAARFGELTHNVDSCIAYQRKEEQEQLAEKLDTADKVKAKAFFHEASFFYDCPNKIVGEMVKHSVDQARYPCPAYDFAAILAMIGTMKSHLFVSSIGLPPVNYFLCFGPTAVGKAHSQLLIDHAMRSLGEANCFFRSVKTEKGIYRSLAENGSRAFVMMDEIEDLLAMLTNSSGKVKVEAYTRGIKQVLLQIYTMYNQLYKSAMTGNEKEKPYVIPNPHLNLIGYATPEALSCGFSVRSLKDGFLPRFSILSTPDVRQRNPNAVANPKLDRDHIRWIRDVAMQGKGVKEESLVEIEEANEELEELKGTKSPENQARKAELLARIEDLKSGGRAIGKAAVIPFTDKAEKMFNRFADKMDAAYTAQTDNPLKALYTRTAEKAARMATVLAEKTITTQVLGWCIEFAENQLKAEFEMYGKDGENLHGGHRNFEEEAYERFMAAMDRMEGRSKAITKRELNRSVKLGSTMFERILKLALERGTIEKLDSRNKSGAKIVEYRKVSELT